MMRDFVVTAKIGKQMCKTKVSRASIRKLTWAAMISKSTAYKFVRRLQLRIVKAVKLERWGLVKYLSRLLTHSHHAKVLAVWRVSTNKGAKTPGVDNVVWKTDRDKVNAVESLGRKNYKALPLRRIYIPKKDKSKLRPLSIPTMHDRAQQALYMLALQPIAETLADPNSYGFRPYRSCADAIAAAFLVLSHSYAATWVYEADIKGCFDNISHEWLLKNIPIDKTILRKWLKCGYIDNHRKLIADKGTPQGGIISPILMNMTLDGLEKLIRQKFPQWKKLKVNFIRYADDFIITASSKELIEKEIAPLVENFLKERGLEISKEKTRISPINEGFNFLSQNVRKYNGTLLIRPSNDAIKSFKQKIKTTIRQHKGHAAHTLIKNLNPIIRGWANYHKGVCSKRTFWKLSKYIFDKLLKWAKQEHPNKKIHWISDKYFSKGEQQGRFSAAKVDEKTGKTTIFQLFAIGLVGIEYTEKMKAELNPFDKSWDEYLERKAKRKRKKALLSHQKCIYLQHKKPSKKAYANKSR